MKKINIKHESTAENLTNELLKGSIKAEGGTKPPFSIKNTPVTRGGTKPPRHKKN